MLSYEEFELELMEELAKHYPDAKIVKESRYKFNRVKKGIVIEGPGNIHPTIYPEEFYEAYQRLEDMELVIGSIDLAIEYEKVEGFKEIVKDWNQAKECIYPYIVNLDKNKSCMDCNEYVYKEKLDFSYGLYLELQDEKDGGLACVNVTKELLKLWNVSEDEVFEIAEKNAKYYVRPMKQVIAELMDLDCSEIDVSEDNAMYVLTNGTRNRGAAGMFDLELLSKTAEELQSNFFILPSSIHEIILLLEESAPTEQMLKEMVEEINQTQVRVEEFLSDNIYYYSRATKDVVRVSMD